MYLYLALGVIGIALGGVAYLTIHEIRITAKEAPGVAVGFGATTLAILGGIAFFLFKR